MPQLRLNRPSLGVLASISASALSVPLTSYGLASRLSYFLWQSTPDVALFAAAQSQKFIDFPAARPQNNVLITLAHAAGRTDVTAIGNPEYCSGPVAEMLA